MDELPGKIGPYEVRDRLGHGGMGVVYLGFDPMLDRPVAIKVLRVPDEETRRRFLREARLAARVHHPHIVSIYAVGEHEGNPYLAMEFIAGRTMAQVIRAGGDDVPLARKVHWLSELCAGLGHAHESGIVHRDVKPSNLLISQSTGTLRLVDFGIAHGNEASGMTMAGMIVGTPQYMSPEQITGQPVDARSDIFSVGTVAYELLTGRQAFGGENLYHVSRQIVGEQPRPIESLAPDVPHALVRTIAKCLQKDPGARAASAKLLEREFLAIARRLDPDHTLVVLPAEPPTLAPGPDATASRNDLLKEAEEAIAQGHLATASGLLHQLESGTSPSADVQVLRQKLQARRLELRLQEVLTRADEASQTGSIEDAEAAINELAELSARHPALERLRRANQERVDQRQVATLTTRARQALREDRLSEAEALVAEALALDPDAPDAVALQKRLGERTRAQRIARLVAHASRALDGDDPAEARRAIDALVALDPAHRDVARLQARLAGIATETAEQPARQPSAPAPSKAPAVAARQPPVKPPAPVGPAVKSGGPPDTPPPFDGLMLRQPPGPMPPTPAAPPPPMAADDGSPSRTPLYAALAVLVLLGLAGVYWMSTRRAAGPVEAPSTTATTSPAEPVPEAGEPPATKPTPTPVAPAPATTTAPPVPVPEPGPRVDPFAASRQLAAAGRFDKAIAAIDLLEREPEALKQEERQRVTETARRNTLAARRGAEDLRVTRSPQYVLGMTRQAAGDRDRTAGRMGAAVDNYMAARTHYLQAFTDNGRPAPPAPAPQEKPAQADTPAQPPPTPAPPPASRVDLSTWSNEEARASIAQFCGAYLGRDMGGLNRLWPNMEPAWRNELREAFATEGELVCVFENVTLIRTSEEFAAKARLLTQLPGGSQRRRSLEISLVPARDRLVIGNIRVR